MTCCQKYNHILKGIISSMIILLSLTSCESKNAQTASSGRFDDLFHTNREIVIKEDEKNLIFSPSLNVTVNDDFVFFPLPKINKILIYSLHDKKITTIGRRGKGPFELLRPVHIAFDRFRNQYEIVDASNYRIQYLDTKFSHKLTINIPFDMIKIFPSLNGYWILSPHSNAGKSYLLLYLERGSLSHSLEFKKSEYTFHSWVGDFDGSSYIAVCNAINPKIFMLNIQNNKLKEITVQGKFPGKEIFKKNPKSIAESKERIKKFNRNPIQVMSILLYDQKIFVTVGGKEINRFFVQIYDYNGNLLYSNIETSYLLLTKFKDKLYFFKLNEYYDKPTEIQMIETEWVGK